MLSGVPQGSLMGPLLFVIYINDLPEIVKRIVKMFADDTKVYGPVSCLDDREEIQNDLYSMCDWSNIWQILFHVLKCKVIHYGRGNPEYSYFMNARELEAVTEEKDLGVLFQKDLKFSSHISQKINKTNSILATIKITFEYLD